MIVFHDNLFKFQKRTSSHFWNGHWVSCGPSLKQQQQNWLERKILTTLGTMETASTGTTKKNRNLLSMDEDKCKDTKTKGYRAELKWKMI